MKNKIKHALKEIERLDDVRVIYACEAGSRAWGFDSENSDWDVRFIYARRINRYVSLTGQDSTIDKNTSLNLETREYVQNTDRELKVDLSGWDLKKTLKQLCKGNPVLSEWFRSPIVYASHSPYEAALRIKVDSFYSKKTGMHYYEHMARGNYNKYIMIRGYRVMYKKYLYILRPIFAMRWLDIKGTPPPMVLTDILNDGEIMEAEPVLTQFAHRLISDKKLGMDMGMRPRTPSVDVVMGQDLDEFRDKAQNAVLEENKELGSLDALFFNMVNDINLTWKEDKDG